MCCIVFWPVAHTPLNFEDPSENCRFSFQFIDDNKILQLGNFFKGHEAKRKAKNVFGFLIHFSSRYDRNALQLTSFLSQRKVSFTD